VNIALLEDIKAHILAEPDAFRMDTWTCGTAHCIAGWALVLTGNKVVNPDSNPGVQHTKDGRYPSDVACEVLGLIRSNDEDGRLFFEYNWPGDLPDRYDAADTRSERAQIAAERIDLFIATNGEE
jgi:hypothetical protein